MNIPSKSEGFGLVDVEALSAGLPILVGSKSGFAKALENVPIGSTCIVYSDDPAEWAKAIEDVRVRHRIRLEKVKSIKIMLWTGVQLEGTMQSSCGVYVKNGLWQELLLRNS